MGTPITISSRSSPSHIVDYLQLCYNRDKQEKKLHDASASSRKVNQSCNNRLKKCMESNSSASMSNIQKVTNWIKSIEGGGRPYDNDVNRNLRVSPNTDKTHVKESEPKSLILVRCDFNKSVTPSQTYFSQINSFNCSTPLINYFQKEDIKLISSPTLHFKSSKTQNIKKSIFVKHQEQEMYSTDVANRLSIESFRENFKLNDDKSGSSLDGYEMALTVESRKKELCNYLKLMDPSDKKQIFNLQNRRSSRVKNLTAIQERKQLAKDIKKVKASSEQGQRQEKSLTMKSFNELNIKVNKPLSVEYEHFFSEVEDGNKEQSELFHFPFPPPRYVESTEDFDIFMKKIIPRYRKICRKKKLNIASKTKIYKRNYLKKKSTEKNRNNFYKKNFAEINLGKSKSTNMKPNQKNTLLKRSQQDTIVRKSRQLTKRHKCGKLLRSNGKINITSILNKTFFKSKQRKNKIDSKQWKRIKRKNTVPNKTILTKYQVVNSLMQPIENSNSGKSSPQLLGNSQCEIVQVSSVSENNIDLKNLMDDLSDFNNLSEEHKKCLIESRIMSTKPIIKNKIQNKSQQETSPLYGFSELDVSKTKIICDTIKNTFDKFGQIHLESKKPNLFEKIHFEGIDTSDLQYSRESKVASCLKPINDNKIVENVLLLCDGASVIEGYNINRECDLSENIFCDRNNSEVNITTIPPEKCKTTEPSMCTPITLEEISCPLQITTVLNNRLELSPRALPRKNDYTICPYNKSVEIKSLQKSLQFIKKKNTMIIDSNLNQEWNSEDAPKPKIKKQSHYIHITKENGNILNVFYIDFNLIVCQEFIVSFWNQTPLGNILGSQNMWIPRGHAQRLVLNNKYTQKKSQEMVLCNETTLAYIELWTKEHKSDIREGPVADIFVTLYFWRQRQNGLEKKVLQLENINGFADDVQYCVMKCFPKIIVSWHSANGDSVSKQTFVHAYQLATDYQMISQVSDIEPVDHYVSSLHNIEDCENLIMGCGENKITLWNLEHGYIIATIELTDIKTSLATLWVKCDRGFLFALQQCVDKELRLIAINGINHTWKKLASYYPAEGFDRLKGVCIENGLLLSVYDQGILCWKAETGEPIEEISSETDLIPAGVYLIFIEENRIFVRHATTHLLSMSVEEL